MLRGLGASILTLALFSSVYAQESDDLIAIPPEKSLTAPQPPKQPKALSEKTISTVSLQKPELTTKGEMVVRGATIELPFQLRILIDSFEITSPDAQKGFVITGHDLHSSNNLELGSERVRCRKFESFTQLVFKSVKAPKDSFVCDTGKKKKIVISEAGLLVSPGAGFLTLDKKIFRGDLYIKKEGDNIYLVNRVPLDPYLAGLANKEMGTQFPDEAIKAQIIAARSYAVASAAERRKHGAFYDVKSNDADQVYAGFIPEDSRTYRLARETRGKVLLHRQEVLRAFYHSSNGGYSELPSAVWGDVVHFDELAYQAKKSAIDSKMDTNRWKVYISPHMGLAWKDLGEIKDIRVLERTTGLRVKRIKIIGTDKTEEMAGPDFRARFGPRWIKSTLFSIHNSGNGWMIEGRGWGHGVGLSQWGAKALAERGWQADRILSYYYPNATIEPIDLEPEQRLDSVPELNIGQSEPLPAPVPAAVPQQNNIAVPQALQAR